MLQTLQTVLPDSSIFAREWIKVQRKESVRICCHHPGQATSTHVSLFYPGFDTFAEECDSVDIDATDATFVMELTKQMSDHFRSKDERMSCMRWLLSDYFNFGIPISEIQETDGLIEFNNPLSVS